MLHKIEYGRVRCSCSGDKLTPEARAPIRLDTLPEPTRYDQVAPRLPEGSFDPNALLVGTGDLELDVGFGRGLSVIERARTAPTSRILGVEIKYKWTAKVAERIERERITNARVFAGDVADFLRRATGAPCLRRVFVHFPDPWWKKRHEKRLVMGPGVQDEIERLLCNGGEIFVQTDVEMRAEQYRALLSSRTALEPFGDEAGSPMLAENPYGARSPREKRAIADGLPVFRMRFRKKR